MLLKSFLKNLCKPKKETFTYSPGYEFIITKHLNIFNNKISQSKSIYWPWVLKVDKYIDKPLGKYYLYYSTDHAAKYGYISLAYADTPTGPFKDYGKIYKNNGYETETPSVVWDKANKNFVMYFHSANSYKGEAQTSYWIKSKDGITWEDNPKKLLNIDMSKVEGDGHNGYFYPFVYKDKLVAYHLFGGGDDPRFGISFAKNPYEWKTDHNQLGFCCLKNNRYMSWNHCTIINIYNKDWLIGMNTNFVSGKTPKDAYVTIVEMKDLYTPVGEPKKLFDLNTKYESPNIRQVYCLKENNNIYVYYQCDNVLNCGTITI
jgi:hypothetical protein